jgi:hypothetical protein
LDWRPFGADNRKGDFMRLFGPLFVASALLAVLTACSDSSEPEAEAEVLDVLSDSLAQSESAGMQVATVTKRAVQAQGTIDVNPCDLLTDAFVSEHLPSAVGSTIEREISEYSIHPSCMVSWRKPNADEIKANTGAVMQEYMQRKMRGEDVQMPKIRTNDELTLTLFEPVFDDSQLAQNSFDQAMSMLQEGVTGTHDGVEVTFQSDVFDVNGVGDKASWAQRLRQLSVVSGGRIFYVTVTTGADNAEELAVAVAVAKDVQKLL